jgi:hypothetical protein
MMIANFVVYVVQLIALCNNVFGRLMQLILVILLHPKTKKKIAFDGIKGHFVALKEGGWDGMTRSDKVQ